ncbi:MAG: response regulator [Chitinispirillia bacterium]|nr:response regulator [Chitinispirillia bacterium]MCL2268150.1 response regulator [Chitinispirillia bacterium]
MDGVRRKVIYVDDVNFGLMTVKDRLKDRYAVFLAQSVHIMFDILRHVKPDVILLDLQMPGIDGYQAIEQLKANPVYADIPVIFVTSQKDRESLLKCVTLGAAAIVAKPFAVERLMDAIEDVFDPSCTKNMFDGLDDDDKPRILAVDDVPSMLRTINYALRDKYKVYTLPKPEMLKKYLNTVTPDLFLLDYKMPTISGIDLIPIIREFPEHKDTPIIFLTSEGTADNLTAAIAIGACDYILKPFEPNMLREKIEKHLKRGSSEAE